MSTVHFFILFLRGRGGGLFGEGCTVSSTMLVVVAILRQEGQDGAERSHCSKQEKSIHYD